MHHRRVDVARVVAVFGVADPRLEYALAIQVHKSGKADHRVFKMSMVITKILPYRHSRFHAWLLGIRVARSANPCAYSGGMGLPCLDASFDDEPEFVRRKFEYMR